MSAIHMTCPACGGFYIAGMVGSTPWPAHRCRSSEQQELADALGALRFKAPEGEATPWAVAIALEVKVLAVVTRLSSEPPPPDTQEVEG